MSKDVTDTVRDVLGTVVRETISNVTDATPKRKSGPLSGVKGIAAGAGLAAAAPLAKRGVDAIRGNGLPSPGAAASKAVSKAGSRVGSNVKDAVTSKVD